METYRENAFIFPDDEGEGEGEVEDVENPIDDEAEINFRRKLRKLLRAVTCELCGETEAGSHEFLEVELARYKDFLMKYEEKAAQMNGLLPFQLRTHLLLNLQSDLIKLIIEPDLDGGIADEEELT